MSNHSVPNGQGTRYRQYSLICLSVLCYNHTNLEKMDVHAIVTRLRDLSKDPQNRSAIAKDEASLSGRT